MLTDGSLNYIYDDAGNPLEQVDAAGVVLYYQHDQYGSTRLLTNATGAIEATFTYDPYGNLTGRTGTADTPLRWNGQYQDADTGLYYLRARYYDPSTAQFLTRDPIEALTLQAYSYGGGNPLNMVDPTGLWFGGVDTALGAAIGGVVGTVFGAGSYLFSTSAGNEDFSWQGLAASTSGGLVGGAVGGACVGTTWVGIAGCGALGGAAGSLTTGLINGHMTLADLAGGVAFGAVGGAAGSKMFPLRGFKPYKLSNVWNPGINSVRLYKQQTMGAGIGLFTGLMPEC
jgi:RHS repeat-associated protein